jgi:hypothetical protein
VAAIALSFWLFFPVGVLSSLSAESPWVILRPKIIGGLLRCFPTTFGFYAVSILLVGGSFALFVGTAVSGVIWLVPVAAVLATTFVMIYARLLGRLGLVVGAALSAQPVKTAKEREPDRPLKPGRRPRRRRPPKAEVTDPWSDPEEPKPMRTPWGGVAEAVEGYGMSADTPPSPPPEKKKRRKDYFPEEEADKPYEMTTPAEPDADREPPVPLPEPDERFMNRTPVKPPPKHPLLEGVYNFPWYRESLRRWVWLTLMVGLVLLLVQGLIAVFPG